MVCCGIDRLQGVEAELTDVAAYDPEPGTWVTLEPSPGTGAYPAQSRRYVAGDLPFLLVGESLGRDLGDVRVHFLSGDRWERVPFDNLHMMGDVVVATSAGPVNAVGGNFAVQIRTDRDRWIDAAEPPFGERTEPSVVTTGDKLLVIGGYEGADFQPPGDAWILDLSGD